MAANAHRNERKYIYSRTAEADFVVCDIQECKRSENAITMQRQTFVARREKEDPLK